MTGLAASLPLALAYFVYPLAFQMASLFGQEPHRNWIDLAWLACGLAALLGACFRGCIAAPARAAFVTGAVLCVLAAWAGVRFGYSWFTGPAALTPFFMELKPLAYAAAAAAWAGWLGAPSRRSFVLWGVALAAGLVIETGIRSVLAGELARPMGSGEVNYDACLLLVSLCAAFAGGVSSSWKAAGLLALGVAASMSRTGLAATAGVLLLCAPARLEVRSALALLCAVGIWLAFLVRGLTLEHLDRYWMWYAGARLFMEEPWGLLAGFAPGRPLPAPVPASLEALWSSQNKDWSLWGVYPFHFHGFWLRASVTWGALATAAGAAFLATASARNRMMLGLVVVCAAMGATMGLFYLSNVGPVLLLAFFAALEPPRKGVSPCQAYPSLS